jgi:hypothetical protein
MSERATGAERSVRWRLLLGGGDADGLGVGLGGREAAMDQAMAALYDPEEKEKNRDRVGRGGSMPSVARWLGDIREFFPSTVVRVMQKDAMERLGLARMLAEPEMLEAVEPDVEFVGQLMALGSVMPTKAKATARIVVNKVVQDLIRKLDAKTRQAIVGALNRATRNNRPRHNEIDWNRTIRANLKHYQPEYKTIVPERRIGYGRKRNELRDIILCIDTSGSMMSSVVYAGVFGAVLASIPSVRTHVVAYDTAVVDLTEKCQDPVDLLFGVQLGGGNDTPRALRYCQGLIRRPTDTIFVLISDLYEGSLSKDMIKLVGAITASGVRMVTLLALDDQGRPSFDERNAAEFAALGVPSFACTPDKFPDMMAAAIQKRDLGQWAAEQGMTAQRAQEEA